MSARLATLLSLGRPSLEATLVAVAEELGATDVPDAHARLAALVERLDEDLRDPALQLDQLGERVGGAFEIVRDSADRSGYDDLRPDVVLRTRVGDELVVAALIAAVGQRRGWNVDVLIGDDHAVVAHHDLGGQIAISPRHESHLIDPTDLRDRSLSWCRSHEVAGALLDRVDNRTALPA